MFRHVRRLRILIAALGGAVVAALAVTVASSHAAHPSRSTSGAASSDAAVELPTSNFNTPAGVLGSLKAAVTYRAGAFPEPFEVTPPERGWGGTQWTATSHGRPAFAGAAFGKPPFGRPRGAINLVTPIGPTPSVADTIGRLRSGGSGTTYERTTPVKIAGFTGRRFDGEVWGKWGHVFVPFSAQTGGASPPDSLRLDKGEVFRIIALNVRGRTVVLVVENWALPPEQFAGFLGIAGRMLATLRFPTS